MWEKAVSRRHGNMYSPREVIEEVEREAIGKRKNNSKEDCIKLYMHVSRCMYVCTCTVCMCVCTVCTCLCVQLYTYSMYVCMYYMYCMYCNVHMYVCMYVHIQYVCVHDCMYCMYCNVDMYVCMYVCICTCTVCMCVCTVCMCMCMLQ